MKSLFLLFIGVAVAFGFSLEGKLITEMPISKETKCEVTQKAVYQNPRWIALAKMKDGRQLYFSSVKTMMRYFFSVSPEETKGIEKRYVVDYNSLKLIEAQKAFYVYGSNIISSVGDDLIPFQFRGDAETFKQEHHGSRVLEYGNIKKNLIDLLNMNY